MKLGHWPALVAVAIFAVLLWPGELGPRPWWLFIAAATVVAVGCVMIFRAVGCVMIFRRARERRDTPP